MRFCHNKDARWENLSQVFQDGSFLYVDFQPPQQILCSNSNNNVDQFEDLELAHQFFHNRTGGGEPCGILPAA